MSFPIRADIIVEVTVGPALALRKLWALIQTRTQRARGLSCCTETAATVWGPLRHKGRYVRCIIQQASREACQRECYLQLAYQRDCYSSDVWMPSQTQRCKFCSLPLSLKSKCRSFYLNIKSFLRNNFTVISFNQSGKKKNYVHQFWRSTSPVF
jgi:hypothetical protein